MGYTHNLIIPKTLNLNHLNLSAMISSSLLHRITSPSFVNALLHLRMLSLLQTLPTWATLQSNILLLHLILHIPLLSCLTHISHRDGAWLLGHAHVYISTQFSPCLLCPFSICLLLLNNCPAHHGDHSQYLCSSDDHWATTIEVPDL